MSVSLSFRPDGRACYRATFIRANGREVSVCVYRNEPGNWGFSLYFSGKDVGTGCYESHRTVHAAKRAAAAWIAVHQVDIDSGRISELAYVYGDLRSFLIGTGLSDMQLDHAQKVRAQRRALSLIRGQMSFTDAEYAQAASMNAARIVVQPFGRLESEYWRAHYLNAKRDADTQRMTAVYGVPPLALLRQLANPTTAEDEQGSTCGARQVGACAGKPRAHKAFPSSFTTPAGYALMTRPRMHQKVGGIHFLRLGRLRLSFCVARKDAPFWEKAPVEYGRLALAAAAILAVVLSSHGIASDWAY